MYKWGATVTSNEHNSVIFSFSYKVQKGNTVHDTHIICPTFKKNFQKWQKKTKFLKIVNVVLAANWKHIPKHL
jgi:hypothetical protein